MIPLEIAEIATLLRNKYDQGDNNKAYQYSIDVAWEVYNIMRN